MSLTVVNAIEVIDPLEPRTSKAPVEPECAPTPSSLGSRHDLAHAINVAALNDSDHEAGGRAHPFVQVDWVTNLYLMGSSASRSLT